MIHRPFIDQGHFKNIPYLPAEHRSGDSAVVAHYCLRKPFSNSDFCLSDSHCYPAYYALHAINASAALC